MKEGGRKKGCEGVGKDDDDEADSHFAAVAAAATEEQKLTREDFFPSSSSGSEGGRAERREERGLESSSVFLSLLLLRSRPSSFFFFLEARFSFSSSAVAACLLAFCLKGGTGRENGEGESGGKKRGRRERERKAPSTKKLLVGGQLNPRMKLYIGITAVRSSLLPLLPPSSSSSSLRSLKQGSGGRGDETDVQISYCPDLLRRFLRLKILSIIPSCFSLLPLLKLESSTGLFLPSSSLAFFACFCLDQASPTSFLLPSVLECSDPGTLQILPGFTLFGMSRVRRSAKKFPSKKTTFSEAN